MRTILIASLLCVPFGAAFAGSQCDALVREADRAQAALNLRAAGGAFEPFHQRSVALAYQTAREGDEARCADAIAQVRAIK